MNRWTTTRSSAALLLAAVLLSACGDDPTGAPVAPTPDVTAAVLSSTSHALVKSLRIELADTASVVVSFHGPDGGGLSVDADTVSRAHQVLLTRLRASTTYTYEARSRNNAGVLGKVSSGTFTTEALPAGVADFVFQTTGAPTRPVTFMQVSASTNGWFGVIAVDAIGKVVWYHRTKTGAMGFMRRPNGDVAIIDDGIFVIGPRGDTVAALHQGGAATFGNIHHAITNSPSGTILFVANDKRVISDTTITGDGIWEWDPLTSVVTKRWTAFDFFDWKTERTTASGATNWLHANALSVGPRGNYILSMRNMNQVASIAPDWKSVEWRMGGPGGTITIATADRFWGQHGAKEIAPGRLLLFDNGFDRPSGESFSRGLEIAVDATAKTAQKVWEYRPTPDNNAVRLGSVQRYSNGNTLLNFGWLVPDPIQIVEVTPAGQVAWRIAPVGTVVQKIYASDPVTSMFGEINP